MRSKKIRDLVAVMRNDGKSCGHIARSLNVCNQSVVNLCNYQLKVIFKNDERSKLLVLSVHIT